ncbi:MAG: lytic transglycosylase domain-containing protein [Gammaproteobacteria bacterium]
MRWPWLLVLGLLPALAWGNEARLAWRQYLASEADKPPAMEFPYQGCFESAARRHDLPVSLLIAVARGESNFNARAVSHAGAHGVMQILWPDTARELGFVQVDDLYQPCRNIDAGARYLRMMLDRYDGDLHLALAAYNYGPGRIAGGDQPVPAGAAWYSGYIRRHLDFVLNGRGRWDSQAEHTVAVFSRPWRAEALVGALSRRAPDVRLDWFREDVDAFRGVLVAASRDELARSKTTLSQLGWRFR